MTGDNDPRHLPDLSDSVSLGLSYKVRCDHLFTAKEIDSFTELYENPQITEIEIQEFLGAHSKFLFLLGLYDVALPQPSFLSSLHDADGCPRRLRLDFLVKETRGCPWDIVELKRPRPPSGSLIVGPWGRRRFSTEIQDSLAQVRTYLDEITQESAQRQFRERGIEIINPVAWVIVGKEENLPFVERRRLERDVPANIRLVTQGIGSGLTIDLFCAFRVVSPHGTETES